MARNCPQRPRRKEISFSATCSLCGVAVGNSSKEVVKVINKNPKISDSCNSVSLHIEEIYKYLIPPSDLQGQIEYASLLGIEYPNNLVEVEKPKKEETKNEVSQALKGELKEVNNEELLFVETGREPSVNQAEETERQKKKKEEVEKIKKYRENFDLFDYIKREMEDRAKKSPLYFTRGNFNIFYKRVMKFRLSDNKQKLACLIYKQVTWLKPEKRISSRKVTKVEKEKNNVAA